MTTASDLRDISLGITEIRYSSMKESTRYVKVVEWSEEDNCYVGSCPGLIYGGCHGDDEKKVGSLWIPD